MPPPRASKLQSRKSVHPDPSLYAAASDTSSPSRASNSTPGSSPGTRKSARLSGDHVEPLTVKPKATNGARKRKSEKQDEPTPKRGKKSTAKTASEPADDGTMAPPVPKFKPRAALAKKANGVAGKRNTASTTNNKSSNEDDTQQQTIPKKRSAADSSATIAGPSNGHRTMTNKQAKGATTPTRSADTTAAILHPTLETPTIVSNILFRAGGEQTPGPASTRRASLDRRGKRGSSIGGGFEALPHPQVPNDQLYKSTNGTDPPARRLRSIISWIAQRQADSLDSSRNNKGKGKADSSAAADDETFRWAKEIVQDWISDVQQLKVDVAVRPRRAGDQRHLPPHPQNVANAQRYAEVQRNYKAIADEEATRADILAKYARLDSDRKSQPTPSASKAALEIDLSELDFETPVFGINKASSSSKTLDMSEVRRIASELASSRSAVPPPLTNKKSAKSGRASTAKSRPSTAAQSSSTGGGAGPDAELDEAISQLTLETSEFRTLVHRQSEFAELASRFVANRNKAVYESYQAEEDDSYIAGGSAAAGGAATVGGMDARDLLRAISRADAGLSSSPTPAASSSSSRKGNPTQSRKR